MKNNQKEKFQISDIYGYIVVVLILIGIVAIIWGINYLMEEFELYNIFFNFNMIVLILLPLYYGINYLIERIGLLKIEKNLIVHKIDIEYHRDIIEKYSPGVLSLVYDGKISYDKDLMLSIMYLKNKGYIDITEDYKIVLTGKDASKLNSNLQMLLKNYDVCLDNELSVERNGKREKTRAGKFHREWNEAICKDAIKEKLVQERQVKGGVFQYSLSIILFLESVFVFMSGNDEYMLLGFSALALAIVTLLLKLLSLSGNYYPKTQKGYEIYAKLKGLKNYIEDYSKLDERTLEDMNIWDDYVVYTVMLNFHTKLNMDAKERYQRLKLRANHKKKH